MMIQLCTRRRNWIRKVRQDLIGNKQIDPNRIGLKTLALTTIVAKLRIEEASEKYVKYLNAVKECGIPSLHDDAVLFRQSRINIHGQQSLSSARTLLEPIRIVRMGSYQ